MRRQPFSGPGIACAQSRPDVEASSLSLPALATSLALNSRQSVSTPDTGKLSGTFDAGCWLSPAPSLRPSHGV